MCRNCIPEDQEKSSAKIAKRAHAELGSAMVALQRASALFSAIELAINSGDKDLPFLLAQVGAETTAVYAERCDAEADFFDGASHV